MMDLRLISLKLIDFGGGPPTAGFCRWEALRVDDFAGALLPIAG